MNRFQKALRKSNTGRPPVWFMRQAGRYHSHYQGLRKKYSFMDLCRLPEVACEVTLGPVEDFGFDAGILFSDLLFPLEAMGMGLSYPEGGPQLDWHLKKKEDLARLRGGRALASHMNFQGEAMKLIRKALPAEKGLLGFVGGPLTLFFYAVAGSHKGDLADARRGMTDGRFEGFCEKLLDMLAENMAIQARTGADTVAILDTCGGEVDVDTFAKKVVPQLKALLERFHKLCPDYPVTYYSKKTDAEYWKHLVDLPISAIGIDWNQPLAKTLNDWADRFAIQGNIDPDWLFLPEAELEQRIRKVWTELLELPASKRRGWICGLGHGVLPKTPESNVRLYLRLQKEMFGQE
jgi:uroporphyrinogen decarboxylase